MLNFDFLTLENFITENSEFLQGANIQKIQQPTRSELLFSMRNNGITRKFYININPQFFHICFLTKETEEKRLLKIPAKPPMFCMLLRKYIEGSKIVKINQPKGERILEFYFRTYDETGEEIYLCLAIELMGKHSNVILYNYDTNVIIGCAHNVGEDKSKVRELYGGLPYVYPPANINSRHSFQGFSNILKSGESVNYQIDNYFSNLQEQNIFNSLKTKLLITVNKNLKHINSSVEKIIKQTKSKEKMEQYRKNADLIMANLYNSNDFSPFIDVVDYETSLPVHIELDETKSLKENAQRYYKLYNKAKNALEKSEEMLKEIMVRQEYFEQILYSINASEAIQDLIEIQEELIPQENENNKKALNQNKKQERQINLTAIHKAPFTIYIGKNNKQNDYIVSKLARKNDLWFHTHNCAGSHILLRAEAGSKFDDEIIFECAKLAKQYSSAKNSSKVGVIYTEAKNLKKPPAANLGYVIYKGEQEIIVD